MSSGTGVVKQNSIPFGQICIVKKTKSADLMTILTIMNRDKNRKNSLKSILLDIKAEYDCYPENALEYIEEKLGIPTVKLQNIIDEIEEKVKEDHDTSIILEFFPECRDCGTRLTNEPFTEIYSISVQSFLCPKCGKENWFYNDLKNLFDDEYDIQMIKRPSMKKGSKQ